MILAKVFFYTQVSKMKILCIKLYCILMNKSNLFSTVLNMSVTQQIKPDSATKVIHCIRTRSNISGSS